MEMFSNFARRLAYFDPVISFFNAVSSFWHLHVIIFNSSNYENTLLRYREGEQTTKLQYEEDDPGYSNKQIYSCLVNIPEIWDSSKHIPRMNIAFTEAITPKFLSSYRDIKNS